MVARTFVPLSTMSDIHRQEFKRPRPRANSDPSFILPPRSLQRSDGRIRRSSDASVYPPLRHELYHQSPDTIQSNLTSIPELEQGSSNEYGIASNSRYTPNQRDIVYPGSIRGSRLCFPEDAHQSGYSSPVMKKPLDMETDTRYLFQNYSPKIPPPYSFSEFIDSTRMPENVLPLYYPYYIQQEVWQDQETQNPSLITRICDFFRNFFHGSESTENSPPPSRPASPFNSPERDNESDYNNPYSTQQNEEENFNTKSEKDTPAPSISDKGGLSYRQRRKGEKHCIVFNRDSVGSQRLFIIVLARALLAFGSPSHRVESQLRSVATIFELPVQFDQIPGTVKIYFGQPGTFSCKTVLVRQGTSLDLRRIHETHNIYRAVMHDEIPASEGWSRLEKLLSRPPLYTKRLEFLLAFLQGFILCGSSFGGSILDMCVSGILNFLVFGGQTIVSRYEMSKIGADIFISGVVSLVARILATAVPNQLFCYQSISSTAVSSLLPGSIMLSGVLELAGRNLMIGSSKLVTGLMTSLYLGFGLTLGSDAWLHFDTKGRRAIAKLASKYETFLGTFVSLDEQNPLTLSGVWSFGEQDSNSMISIVKGCYRDQGRGWWQQPLPWYSLFVLLPVLNVVISMRRAQPLKSVQMPVMVLISCLSTAVTRAVDIKCGLDGHPDYTALLGSFVVSLLGNMYSRKYGGTAFTIMLTGILLLIPTGLAEAGGLSSSYMEPGQDEYTRSLELARKMISVIIGVTSGVYLSARIVYAFGKKKNSAFVTF